MPYKNKISAREFINKRDSETVRAKDVDRKALYDRAALIENLKMMVHYEKVLCVLQSSGGEYIEIYHWGILKDRYSIFESDQYTFIPIIDYFVMLYEDKMIYLLSKVAKTSERTSSCLEQPKKTIKLKKPSNSNDNIEISYKKKKIDRSLGVSGVIEQLNKMDEYDFLDLLSIGKLDAYIKFLPSRYHAYIFLEVMEDYRAGMKHLDLFSTIKDKQKKADKYIRAVDTIMEIDYLFSYEQKNILSEIEDVIRENIMISQAEHKKKIKNMIINRLKAEGLSPTAAENFYTELQTN